MQHAYTNNELLCEITTDNKYIEINNSSHV